MAIRLAESAARARPGLGDAWFLLGTAQLNTGSLAQAEQNLARAAELLPDRADVHTNLGIVRRSAGNLAKAHESLDAALRIDRRSPNATAAKAETLLLEDRADEAVALLEPFLQRDEVMPPIAIAHARASMRTGDPGRAEAHLRRCAEDESRPNAQRVPLLFLLGDVLDRSGRHDDAFEVYRRANEMCRAPFDARAHAVSIDQMISQWTRERIAGMPRADNEAGRSEKPIFIVGMPRSGTSLVEQVLASLPGVHGGGELEVLPRLVYRLVAPLGLGTVSLVPSPGILTRMVVNENAAAYLDQLDSLAPEAHRITDKMPQNLFHLGFINAMFPDARVVHCVRDPLDTCLSCYFTNFGSGLDYPYDLSNLAAFYNDQRRLMDHWKQVLDVPVHDVAYEELVAEPEATMRRLVGFCGLEWDDACLEFHRNPRVTTTASSDQVRRPLYSTSVGRWRRYEKHIQPLIDGINPDYVRTHGTTES